ncbi:hypothetical protein SAMN06265339_0195 [Desulfurobacterium pacificum]|uniref:DUF2202 domain-containing protein n=1 Tax=Desulfurobacterium pacificum TaxID=240166 RepID=A0ABY1NAC8_9BACT|nr:DUF2202 domain-containing protein [Desulfurobacterium pacificum]SMP04284.1 hypothetical protein SAMN06265339_0195 [Desulfurobacterium pacificum]
MRKLIAITMTLVALGGISASQAANVKENAPPALTYLKNLPKQPLSPQEIKDLIHMREEEKLARDVYLTLSKYYPLPVFKNIAKSENWHTKMIAFLLKRYNIKDPVKEVGDKVGVFKSKKMRELYVQLVNQGKKSLIDALKVGATIEDLDIKDLEDAISRTDNKDIKFVYQNLMKGSRNHMRAFVGILRRFGLDYTPKYISKAEFDRIMSTKHETGVYTTSGYSLINSAEISGTVVGVKQVPGYGRRGVTWWAVDVKTDKGVVEVRLAPTWFYRSLGVKEGDKVTFTGFQPPFWIMKGLNGYMACTLKDENTGVSYDFSWRRWCKKVSTSSTTKKRFSAVSRKTTVIKGIVAKVEQRKGLRRPINWWVVEVITPTNERYTVYLSPVWRLANPDVKVGDDVEVGVYTPPVWRRFNTSNTYMACYIKDLTTNKETTLRRCP